MFLGSWACFGHRAESGTFRQIRASHSFADTFRHFQVLFQDSDAARSGMISPDPHKQNFHGIVPGLSGVSTIWGVNHPQS